MQPVGLPLFHRGLVIEDAWGTDGVSHITVTGNTFNNITAVDGGIAFQRFTDGSPANTATIDRLNDVNIHDNSFTGLGAGVNPVYVNPDYFGAGAVLPAASMTPSSSSVHQVPTSSLTPAPARTRSSPVQGTIPSPVVSATIPSPAARAMTRLTAGPALTR